MSQATAAPSDGVAAVVAATALMRRASMAALQDYTRTKRGADPDDLAWHLIIERLIFDTEAELRWLDHCEAAAVRATSRRRTAQQAAARVAQPAVVRAVTGEQA